MPAVPEKSDFKTTQYRFAAHIRDPRNQPAPAGVEPQRMAMYRELFYNNVESFLSGSFPVLRRLFEETTWHALVQDFFSRHRSKTPYFAEIAEEFIEFLQHEREADALDPPFMLELAHYEWVEMALAISEEEPPADAPADGEGLLDCVITLSDVAWPLGYRFPVHRISPDFRPEAPPDTPTYLLVYRDRDDEVRFSECNPVTFRLLQLLQENEDRPARRCLEQIADELKHPRPEVVVAGGEQTLRDLAARGVLKTVP